MTNAMKMTPDQVEYAENLHLLGYTPDKIKEAQYRKMEKDGLGTGGGDCPLEEILQIVVEFDTALVEDATGDDIGKAKAIRRLEIIYMKSFAIQDFKTCLGIQKEINKLQGWAGG
ncbi:MAG: hypothetical protein KAG97_11700 [Victivallales bacterium]|nr:hypothetical protein [Victivallales bacterium]